jgi:hypothetical protein
MQIQPTQKAARLIYDVAAQWSRACVVGDILNQFY